MAAAQAPGVGSGVALGHEEVSVTALLGYSMPCVSAFVPEPRYPETMRAAPEDLVSFCSREEAADGACTASGREPILRTTRGAYRAIFYGRAEMGWQT